MKSEQITEVVTDEAVLLEIRGRLASAGARMRPATDLANIALVLKHTGSPDLTVDAILMAPRPAWLYELIGNELRRVRVQAGT